MKPRVYKDGRYWAVTDGYCTWRYYFWSVAMNRALSLARTR
jgi:hypothetical protein